MGNKSKTIQPRMNADERRLQAGSAASYTRDAEQECAAFHRRTGRIFNLLTVREILDEEHVQKM